MNFISSMLDLSSKELRLEFERVIVSKLLEKHPYVLFVFSNKGQDRWHFLNVKYAEDHKKRRLFRRITIGPEEELRTASERISLLDLSGISPNLWGVSPLIIQDAHDTAFDVEAVTEQFFNEYKKVFRDLEDDLNRQTKDLPWAHDYALQFLNRTMFLYFVQRKRWLGDDTEFLRSFWESYQRGSQPKDTFFDRWLKILFFEAFNNEFHGKHKQFPEEINEHLLMAPYLNGGLFRSNKLDTKSFTITDARFKQVFTFFEGYNFTIAEDSPLDQEVAVDPEMIGKVYESLVNVSTEADERGDAGIFYTPRTEIDLMCRLSLVDYITNHLGSENKNLIYEAVFAMTQDEKEPADKSLAKAGLWSKFNELLRSMTTLDPACGSGSFIVGMLHVLDDLQRRANSQLGIAETGFERKKRIIWQSLYGVDVMPWACHVAELRLWLALVIDANFTREELHVRNEPLLPHLTFKVRHGDSLVQEVGGLNLSKIHASKEISNDLKARILELKSEKVKFYNNDPACLFKSDDILKRAELNLFKEILEAGHIKIEENIGLLKRKLEQHSPLQMGFDGSVDVKPQQISIESIDVKRQVEVLEANLERISRTRTALKSTKDVPFIWDIAFVEIFEGDNDGFDVVIGNPPYVQQESISDPHLMRETINTENKKEYKAKLIRSVYQTFDKFFSYRVENDNDHLKPEKAVTRKINAKSDLYIYFYFHGLSLLNKQGSFCFITSNSWLDVGYGTDLQEFLLKHCHVKMVIDNQAKRSFASADVNTIIALFSAPNESEDWGLEKTARFVMFKVPFEHIIDPVIFEEIEDSTECFVSNEYRVFPVLQKALFKDGCKAPDDDYIAETDTAPVQSKKSLSTPKLFITDKYEGNKWGGKYLRAPDIFFKLLEKGSHYIESMSNYFEGERYLNTGGADGFFIITDTTPEKNGMIAIRNEATINNKAGVFSGTIEEKYLVPTIKDYTKKDKKIEIDGFDAYCLVVDDKPATIKKTNVYEYIKWGEKQGYDQRSVTKSQTPWYKPTRQMLHSSQILVPRSFHDRFVIHCNPKNYLSLRFYRLHPKKSSVPLLTAFLNTTFMALFIETLGNKSLGQGVLDFFMADFLNLRIPIILDKALLTPFKDIKKRTSRSIFEELGINSDNPIREQKPNPLPDRKVLDDIVFDALGLAAAERKEVYWAVCEMVNNRLNKARSV